MTIGERIAALRREKGLSQEGLGDKLGVSRQAISKWESDASLPEIDKLVALSRLFGIPVGELLGVEEAAEERTAELTPEQLRMAQEIAAKYIEAYPQPAPVRGKLPTAVKIAAAGAAVVLAVLLMQVFSLSDTVGLLRQENSELQNRVNSISINVDRATNDMTQRMEDILKKQNDLVADSGFSVLWADYGTGLVQISLYALPRNYTNGMTAVFSAGEKSAEAQLNNGRFEAELELNMYEELEPVYVYFEAGETRSSQCLEDVYLFDQLPYPNLWMSRDIIWDWGLWGRDVSEAQTIELAIPETVSVAGCVPAAENHNALSAERGGLALFVNGELVWSAADILCGDETDDVMPAYEERSLEGLRQLKITLPAMNKGDVVQLLTGVLDNYGRLHMGDYQSYVVDEGRMLSLTDEGSSAAAEEAPTADSPLGQTLLKLMTSD